MSNEVIKVLDAFSQKFGIAVNWTSENIMPYLQQLGDKCVRYKIATSVVWLLFGIVCLILVKPLFKKGSYYFNKVRKEKMDAVSEEFYSMLYTGAYAIGASCIVIGVFLLVTQTIDIVTCVAFPEKVVIDELQSIYSTLK